MSHELTITSNNWLDFRKAISTISRPFQKDIELCTIRVAGMMHIDDITAKCQYLAKGNPLTLKPVKKPSGEPVVTVFANSTDELGYISGVVGEICGNLLLAGKRLTAQISHLELVSGFSIQLDVTIILSDD